MFRMGGLRQQLPFTFWTFLIGSASLSALPLITAGFYSKDLILWHAFSSPAGSPWLSAAGLLGAFLTSLYTFRMVFLTFFGPANSQISHRPSIRMELPLGVLAFFSIFAGFVEEFRPSSAISRLFPPCSRPYCPNQTASAAGSATEALLTLVAALIALGGIYLAYVLYHIAAGTYPKPSSGARGWRERSTASGSPAGALTGSTTSCSSGLMSGWRASTRRISLIRFTRDRRAFRSLNRG